MIIASPLIEEFIAKVIQTNPSHECFLRNSLIGISAESGVSLHGYLEYCTSKGLTIDYLVLSYNTITVDTHLEQIHFRRNKRYRHSTFAEVADKVYYNSEYMRRYMYGLAITSFLWPNHEAIHEFYIRTFPKEITGTYLEVGPGHGYYFLQAAKNGQFDKLVGVDISAASVSLTNELVDYYDVRNDRRIDIYEYDFLLFDGARDDYSCIVMGEVLEHVEEPEKFLKKIENISNPLTHIFITTCVNAPAIDHIYLFSDTAEIESMIEESGLVIKNKYYAPYQNLSIQECIAQQLPVNVAYLLRKR